MKQIPLTQGKFAIVDDEDYEELSKYKWHFSKFYATRRKYITKGSKNRKSITFYMHKETLKTTEMIDHINGNGLDNRKENLRVCSYRENMMNRRSANHSTSKYKGVSWHKKGQKWSAQIHTPKKKHLGLFDCEIQAAKAYNEAALKYFGEFARVNSL